MKHKQILGASIHYNTPENTVLSYAIDTGNSVYSKIEYKKHELKVYDCSRRLVWVVYVPYNATVALRYAHNIENTQYNGHELQA